MYVIQMKKKCLKSLLNYQFHALAIKVLFQYDAHVLHIRAKKKKVKHVPLPI